MQYLYLNENNRLQKCDAQHEATHVHMTIEEYNSLISIMQNLKRINKEKSNQEREIQPKKHRCGYLLLSYDTNTFRMNFGKESASFESRRLLLETPYRINLGYKDTLKLVNEDVLKIANSFNATTSLDKNSISNIEEFYNYFTKDAENILFIYGLEAQRNGFWAVRLFANFTPDVPVDCINDNKKK